MLPVLTRIRYYEWAYGRLAESDSDIGPLGEFLIGSRLDCLSPARKVNAPFDLVTSDGMTIEVKTSSKRRVKKDGSAQYRWDVRDQRTALEGRRELAQRWVFLAADFPEGAERRRSFNVFADRYWKVAVLTDGQMRAAGVKREVTEATLRRMGVGLTGLAKVRELLGAAS